MSIDQESLTILREAYEDGSTVLFAGSGLDIVFQTEVLAVERDYVSLANRVLPIYIKRVMNSETFSLQCKMVRFTTTKIESDGENIVFPLKELKRIEETRSAERFPFDAEERVICEILNPYDEETILSRPVLDMSASGLSIRCPIPSKLFEPGTTFNQIRVMIDGEPYTKAAAKVVYTRKMLDMNDKLRVQVGLKLET